MTTCTQPLAGNHPHPALYATGKLGAGEEPDMPHLDSMRPYIDPNAPKRKRTKQEQDLLDEKAMSLRAHGKTFRQIAVYLGITPASAHGRVKRHLHRQRVKFEEHAADQRDYDLQILQEMETMHRKKATEGDSRSYYLVMRAMELRQKLKKIPSPTNIELLLRKQDISQTVAKDFDESLIEDEEKGVAEAGLQVPGAGTTKWSPAPPREVAPPQQVAAPLEVAAPKKVTPGRRDLQSEPVDPRGQSRSTKIGTVPDEQPANKPGTKQEQAGEQQEEHGREQEPQTVAVTCVTAGENFFPGQSANEADETKRADDIGGGFNRHGQAGEAQSGKSRQAGTPDVPVSGTADHSPRRAVPAAGETDRGPTYQQPPVASAIPLTGYGQAEPDAAATILTPDNQYQ